MKGNPEQEHGHYAVVNTLISSGDRFDFVLSSFQDVLIGLETEEEPRIEWWFRPKAYKRYFTGCKKQQEYGEGQNIKSGDMLSMVIQGNDCSFVLNDRVNLGVCFRDHRFSELEVKPFVYLSSAYDCIELLN